jgi:hypothetical protein
MRYFDKVSRNAQGRPYLINVQTCPTLMNELRTFGEERLALKQEEAMKEFRHSMPKEK